MKVVVSSDGHDLDAPVSSSFGRCQSYLLVDPETGSFDRLDNPAASAGGGAGIQAAQLVIEQGAQAVLASNVGPNAFQVFSAAGIPVFLVAGLTARQAVEAYSGGQLKPAAGANVASHSGLPAKPR